MYACVSREDLLDWEMFREADTLQVWEVGQLDVWLGSGGENSNR